MFHKWMREKIHRRGRKEGPPVGIGLLARSAFGWDEQGEKNILRENANLDDMVKGLHLQTAPTGSDA